MNTDRFKFRIWSEKLKRYYWNYAINVDGDLVHWMSDHKEEDVGEKLIREKCTGLRDKNGKLIYEGDIVDMYIPQEDAHRKCVVEYVIDSGTAQWVCRYIEGKRRHSTFGLSFAITGEFLDGNYCKIIGNIHDNQFRDVAKMTERQNDSR